MLEQKAIVTQVFDDSVEVEYQISSSCSSCASEDSCGVGTVSKAFSGKTNKVVVSTPLILAKGQVVSIETLESNILLSCAVTYLLPLFGLLVFSLIAQELLVVKAQLHQLSAIVVGILGGFAAQQVGRFLLKAMSNSQPIIVIRNAQY